MEPRLPHGASIQGPGYFINRPRSSQLVDRVEAIKAVCSTSAIRLCLHIHGRQ